MCINIFRYPLVQVTLLICIYIHHSSLTYLSFSWVSNYYSFHFQLGDPVVVDLQDEFNGLALKRSTFAKTLEPCPSPPSANEL